MRLSRVFRGAGTADLPSYESISEITIPVLILGWTGDPGHPLTTAALLQELMPHAELAVATTRCGMTSWTRRIEGFLSRNADTR